MRSHAPPAPARAAAPAKSAVARRPATAPADLAGAVERATRLGHHFGRVSVSVPPPAQPARDPQPIQAKFRHRAKELYGDAKEKLGNVKEKYGDVKEKYGDIKDRLAKNKTLGKARAVMGVLGLAGGYRQATGDQGGEEARGAFADKWEDYFKGLSPKEEQKARHKYGLPDHELDQKEDDWREKKKEERRQAKEERGQAKEERRRDKEKRRQAEKASKPGSQPQEIEMQELKPPPLEDPYGSGVANDGGTGDGVPQPGSRT